MIFEETCPKCGFVISYEKKTTLKCKHCGTLTRPCSACLDEHHYKEMGCKDCILSPPLEDNNLIPKKRGRPRKNPQTIPQNSAPKKRGRPRKVEKKCA